MKSIICACALLILVSMNIVHAQEYQILDNSKYITYIEDDTPSVGAAYLELRTRFSTSTGQQGNPILVSLIKGPLTIRGDHELLFCSSIFSFDSKREELLSPDGTQVIGSHIQCTEPGCLFPPCSFISFLQLGESTSSPYYELIEK